MKSIIIDALCTFAVLVLINSCVTEEAGILYTDSSNQETVVKTRGDLNQPNRSLSFVIKEKKITREFVPLILERALDRSLFKQTDSYTLTTVTKNGRNLMHVANFNKGGWAIVSGRFQEDNLILAYGAEGEFDPGNIESPEVRFWLERAESMLEQEMIEDEESVSAEAFRSGPYDDDPYVWLKVPVGCQNSSELYESVSPLTTTNWGQRDPWNWLCPVDPNTSTVCPLGCSAVAVSQMLYYLHNKIGVPSGLYHTIDTSFVWHPSDNYFTSSSIKSDYIDPSILWNYMQKNKIPSQTFYTKNTGRFIFDVADRLHTTFSSSSGSGASTKTSIFSSFGISCDSLLGFYQSITTNSIRNLMPVLVRADDSNNTRTNNDDGGSHAWIIDGYKIFRHTSDNQMYLRIIPTDSLSFYPDLNYDMILTDSQKQSLYPDIEEYEIIHDYSYYYNTLYHMNWGWNGIDNGYYSSNPLLWNPSPYVFSDGIIMFYGFTESN